MAAGHQTYISSIEELQICVTNIVATINTMYDSTPCVALQLSLGASSQSHNGHIYRRGQ